MKHLPSTFLFLLALLLPLTGLAINTSKSPSGVNFSVMSENIVNKTSDNRGSYAILIDDIEAEAGSIVTIPIVLNNDTTVKGFMFDFYYPENFDVNYYTQSDRIITGASLSGHNNAEEHYFRFLAMNLSSNIVVDAGSGPILTIRLDNN